MIDKNVFKNLSPIIISYGVIFNELVYRLAKSNPLYYFIIGLSMILTPIMLKFNETINGNRKIIALVVFELSFVGLVLIKYFLE